MRGLANGRPIMFVRLYHDAVQVVHARALQAGASDDAAVSKAGSDRGAAEFDDGMRGVGSIPCPTPPESRLEAIIQRARYSAEDKPRPAGDREA